MKKEIYYTPHLKLRLKIREIPYDLPRKIYETATEKYIDRETGKKIVVKKVNYKNKTREMSVIYEEKINEIAIITIHPLKAYQKLSRLKSGRWEKIL